MKTIYTFIVATLLANSLNAQAPNMDWQLSMGGGASDYANGIEPLIGGYYATVGSTNSNDGDVSGNHGGFDILLTITTANGTFAGSHLYGGSGDDVAEDLQQTSDGGFIIVGSTTSTDGDITNGGLGGNDIWVLKLDNAFAVEWQKVYGGSGDDQGRSVMETSTGGYIVLGITNSTDGTVVGNHGVYDIHVLRLNNAGNAEMVKTLGGSSLEYGKAIRETPDRGFVLAVYVNSNDGDVSGKHGGGDFWVVKLDATPANNIQWQKCFGGSGDENPKNIETTADGGYFVSGYTTSNDGDVTGNHGSHDFWAVKLDGTGTVQWQKCFGGSDDDLSTTAKQTSDGGYILGGYSKSTDGDVTGNHGDFDAWAVRLDATGTLLWQKSMGGSNTDFITDVAQATDGGYILSCYSKSTDGDVTGAHGAQDFWDVKLKPDLAVDEFDANLISIYPNPAIDSFNIVFGQKPSGYAVSVVNLLGQSVFKSKINGAQMQVTTNGWASGMYFVNITDENGTRTTKKLLIE